MWLVIDAGGARGYRQKGNSTELGVPPFYSSVDLVGFAEFGKVPFHDINRLDGYVPDEVSTIYQSQENVHLFTKCKPNPAGALVPLVYEHFHRTKQLAEY